MLTRKRLVWSLVAAAVALGVPAATSCTPAPTRAQGPVRPPPYPAGHDLAPDVDFGRAAGARDPLAHDPAALEAADDAEQPNLQQQGAFSPTNAAGAPSPYGQVQIKAELTGVPPRDPPKRLVVPLLPRGEATSLGGTVTLAEERGGIVVTVRVTGAPDGVRGVHLHEKADCSAADASSTGRHWNPDKRAHGFPAADVHHLGDLGNVRIGKDGAGLLTVLVPGATLDRGTYGLIGLALVVHAQRDDGKTQPHGNAGGAIGCAEILETTGL